MTARADARRTTGGAVLAALLSAIATLVGLCLLLGGVLVFVADGEALRPIAERAATLALGRETRIGALDLRRGRLLRVIARDVAIAGPDGGPGARIGRLETAIRTASLFEARLDIPELVVADADLTLGAGVEEVVAEAAPERRRETPGIRRARFENVRLNWTRADGEAERIHVIEAEGSAASGEPVRLTGEADWRGDRLAIEAEGAPFDDLVDGRRYPFRATLDGPARATVEAVLAPGGDFAPESATLTLEGPNLAAVGALLGAPLPATPAYALSGDVRVEAPGVYALSGVSGRVGDSDAAVDLRVDLTGERPRAEGVVVSDELHLADLGPLVGGGGRSAGLLPDVPPPVAALRAVDLDIRLKAGRVVAPTTEVEALDARFVLEDGRLLVRPLSLAVAGGRAEGEAALNVREATPSADLELAFTDIDIKPYFAGTPLVQEMAGRFSGRLYVLGVGETLAQMATQARGGGHLVMQGGSVSGLAVEVIGLDLTEALGLAVFEDVGVPIHCVGAAFDVDGARWSILQAIASTEDSTLLARGGLDMAARRLDVEIEARAKDFSLIDYNSPVRVHGPLDDLSIAIAELDPLPFFEMGDEQAPPCDRIVASVRKAAPGRQ